MMPELSSRLITDINRALWTMAEHYMYNLILQGLGYTIPKKTIQVAVLPSDAQVNKSVHLCPLGLVVG